MKFTFISSAVGIALLSSSAVAQPKMGMYELDPLGSNTDGKPTVKFNNFPFAADFFIEASTQRPTLKHTVYNMNGKESGTSCSDGDSIDATPSVQTVDYNNRFSTDGYPAHSSAEMLMVSVSLSQEVHDSIVNENGDTTDVCLRSWYEANFGGTDQVANYLDIRIQATKTVKGSVASFTQSVTIAEKSSQPLSSNQELTLTVLVTSKLCDDDGNDAAETTFKSGEDFRVCLSAQRLEETEYTITDITSVTCEIGTVTRNLIDNGVADGVTRKSGATFRSVVTPDYFSGDSRTLACSGTVALEKVTTTAPTPAPLPDWFLAHDRDSTTMELYDEQLRGTIPSEIGKFSSLTGIYLENNQLTGKIPSEIGLLTGLEYLYLDNNQLTGGIPSEIGLLPSLLELYLNINQLTGKVPTQIGNLSSLQYLNLTENQLSGGMPSQVSSIPGLTYSMRRLESKSSLIHEHETRSLQVDESIPTEGTFDIGIELDGNDAEIDQAGGVGLSGLRYFSLVVAALWTVGALFF